MNASILTLDAGTSSLKCTLFDTDGQVLATSASAYGTAFPENGWAEQPVEHLLVAMRRAVREVVGKTDARAVAAIGLSGAMNSFIPLDAAGNALHPNIIGADARATAQVDAIRAVIPDEAYYERTGNRIDPHYSLPKMLWLRENRPDAYKRARWFVHTKDALYGFLTGRYGLSDYSDASLTGALQIDEGRWDEDLLRALDLDARRMPQLRVSHDVEGHLTRNAARLLGLVGGIPVTVGAGDGACAAHGAGLAEPGGAYVSLGSGAGMGVITETPVVDPVMRVFNYFDMDGRQYHACGAVQCAASALTWAAAEMLLADKPENPDDPGALFTEMEALAMGSPAGARGVFFLPTLLGERTPWWDTNARGTLVGMSMRHSRADIARAVYEGVAQAVHLCGDVLEENGLTYDSLTLVGGGAQSAIWPQMFADMTDLRVRAHREPRAATALGAAMAAGVGIELFPGYAEAARMARFAPDLVPDPARHVAYIPHFTIYRTIYRRLREVYRDIVEYQGRG